MNRNTIDTKIDTSTEMPVEESIEKPIKTSIKESFDALVYQLVLPEALPLKLKALSLVGDLAQLPVYQLGCTISQEAVALSYDALMNGL